jgi:hypothetical protein
MTNHPLPPDPTRMATTDILYCLREVSLFARPSSTEFTSLDCYLEWSHLLRPTRTQQIPPIRPPGSLLCAQRAKHCPLSPVHSASSPQVAGWGGRKWAPKVRQKLSPTFQESQNREPQKDAPEGAAQNGAVQNGATHISIAEPVPFSGMCALLSGWMRFSECLVGACGCV